MIVDTSVVYALLDAADESHRMVAAWYEESLPVFVTTPLILAEIDHLAGARAGAAARAAWWRDLAAGAYRVEWWRTAAGESVDIAERYADLGIGLADASLVALAARLGTTEIATLDQRHFRMVRPLTGGDAFTIRPIDS